MEAPEKYKRIQVIGFRKPAVKLVFETLIFAVIARKPCDVAIPRLEGKCSELRHE